MPIAIAASEAAHNPPFEVWPHKKARLRARAPGPHRWRHEIATAIRCHDPMRSAAGALHAHLREVAELCSGQRGATVARGLCAAFAARLASRSIGDFRGPFQHLLADHGISASDRTALAGVRLLASLSSLIEVDLRAGRVRLRLSEQFHRAAAVARRCHINARWFAPAVVADPSQKGFFSGFEHRTAEKPVASESGSVIEARVRGETVLSRTHSELLRQISVGRWVRLAANIVGLYPDLCRGRICSAMSRALLAAHGVSHGYREVEGLLRGLRYLLREGFLRADASGSLGLDSDRHPDLVVLGILAPPDARACSQETARYLRRRGVVAPEALGHHEAQALRRRLWWRASKELPTLPEVRVMLGFEMQPADLDAYAEQVELADRSWSWGLGRQHTLTLDRASFSAQMRSGSTTTMHGWHDEPEDSRSAGTDEAVVTRDSAWGWAHYEADGAGPDEQPGDDERPDTHDEGDRGAGQSACADPRRGWHRGCWSRDAWHRAPGCSHADPVASPVCRAGVGKLPGTSGALVDTLSEGPFQAVRCAPIAALVPSGPCPVSRPSAARSARSRVFPSWWTPLVGSAA